MKSYSFLREFAITTAMAGAGAIMGGYGLIKNIRQNRIDSKYIESMRKDLYNCKDRNSAINILNQYCNNLQQFKGNDKINLAPTQYKLKIYYYNPVMKILMNQQDDMWHHNMMKYMSTTTNNIIKGNLINNVKSGIGTGMMATGALNVALPAAAITTYSIYNLAIRQLKFFKSRWYINKMTKELENCQTRQQALSTVEKYSYQISNAIKNNVQKTKKVIPYDIEKQIKLQFYIPLSRIITTNSDISWKVAMMDFLKTNTLETSLQHVCDTALYFILPKIIRGGKMKQ